MSTVNWSRNSTKRINENESGSISTGTIAKNEQKQPYLSLSTKYGCLILKRCSVLVQQNVQQL